MNSELVFEGLETLEARIRTLNGDAAFIVISDRTDSKHEEGLGRFDLVPACAIPYLSRIFDPEIQEAGTGMGARDLTDEGMDDDDDDDDQADGGSDSSPLRGAIGRGSESKLAFADILEAACRWLRDTASRNTLGEEYRRFRVKVHGPKAMNLLDTGSFLVKNPGWKPPGARGSVEAEATLPPPISMPVPTFDDAALTTATKSMKVLGDLYSQWGHILLGGVNQLQGVNNSMIGKLHLQLTESRDQVDQLVANILEFRVAQLSAAEDRNVQTHQEDSRSALARDAIKQLGDAAKVFLSARGVTPELADVVNTMGASPELMAALNDPDVKELLKDSNNLHLLAGLLKQFGAQNRAARAGVPPEAAQQAQPSAPPNAAG